MLFAVGCGVNPSNYATEIAEIECNLYQECDLLVAYGGTLESCLIAVETLEQARANSETCEYNGSEANSCLQEREATTCEDLSSSALNGTASSCDEICNGN